MSSLVEGVHDALVGSTDPDNKLVRVGSKYNATAPAVSDGDNVYILLDAAGRVVVTGPVASDGVALGNPLPIGGDVDDTSPAAAAEGDRRVFRSTPEGNQIVELYKDNNALSPIAAMPGASEVKADFDATGATSTTRETLITPTSGKKIRIIAIMATLNSATAAIIGLYFGTGVDYSTNPGSIVALFLLDLTDLPSDKTNFPDGGGPVGAADEVLSVATNVDIGANAQFAIIYREE